VENVSLPFAEVTLFSILVRLVKIICQIRWCSRCSYYSDMFIFWNETGF